MRWFSALLFLGLLVSPSWGQAQGVRDGDLRSKTQPVFDVTNSAYGAIPNDNLDDRAGIQAAVDAACLAAGSNASNGATVFIPAGTFHLDEVGGGTLYSIEIAATSRGAGTTCDGVRIIGAGRDATFIQGMDGAQDGANNRTLFRFNDCDRCGLEAMTIDGNDPTNAGIDWDNGVRGTDVDESVFRDLRLKEFDNHGWVLRADPGISGSDDNVVENVWSDGRQTSCMIYATAAGGTKNYRNQVINNVCRNSSVFFGLEVRFSDDTIITGGQFYGNGTNDVVGSLCGSPPCGGGINVEEASTGTIINGVNSSSNIGPGIQLFGIGANRVTDTIITDSVLSGSTQSHGVLCARADRTLIANSLIFGNQVQGYNDQNNVGEQCTTTTFSDVAIRDNNGYGAQLRGDGHRFEGGAVIDNDQDGASSDSAGIMVLSTVSTLSIVGTRVEGNLGDETSTNADISTQSNYLMKKFDITTDELGFSLVPTSKTLMQNVFIPINQASRANGDTTQQPREFTTGTSDPNFMSQAVLELDAQNERAFDLRLNNLSNFATAGDVKIKVRVEDKSPLTVRWRTGADYDTDEVLAGNDVWQWIEHTIPFATITSTVSATCTGTTPTRTCSGGAWDTTTGFDVVSGQLNSAALPGGNDECDADEDCQHVLAGMRLNTAGGDILWVDGYMIETSNRTLDIDYGNETITSTWDMDGAILELPSPDDCETGTTTECDEAAENGRICIDSNGVSGQRIFVCEGVSGWVQQAGAGGSGDSITVGTGATAVDTEANFPNDGTGDIIFAHGDGTGPGGSDVVSGTLDIDSVGPDEMADVDHGDITWTGGDAQVDADAVLLNEIGDPGADSTIAHGVNATTLTWDIPDGGDQALEGLVLSMQLSDLTDAALQKVLVIQRPDVATADADETLEQLVRIDNLDADGLVTHGIACGTAAGGMTQCLDIGNNTSGTIARGINFDMTKTTTAMRFVHTSGTACLGWQDATTPRPFRDDDCDGVKDGAEPYLDAATSTVSFDNVLAGTSTSTALVVGNGSSLTKTGTGVIESTCINTDGDANCEVLINGASIEMDYDDDGTADCVIDSTGIDCGDSSDPRINFREADIDAGDVDGYIDFDCAATDNCTMSWGVEDGDDAELEIMTLTSSAGTVYFRVGNLSGGNYVEISEAGLLQFFGTGDIDLPAASVDIADVNASGTPSSSTFLRGDGTWNAPAGSGDVTAVGPGCASGDCLTDGVATSGTTLMVWEGNVADAEQVTFAMSSAEPAAAYTITFPDETGTVCTTGSVCTGYEPAGTYSGVGTCTNQFVRALNDGAGPTCATVAEDDIAASLAFDDGDLLDLTSVNPNTATEGIILPQGTSCTSATAEGQVCWENDATPRLFVGNGTSAVSFNRTGTTSDGAFCVWDNTAQEVDCNVSSTGTGTNVRSGSPTITTPTVTTAISVNGVAAGSDMADAGSVRLENNESIAWEANPTGTDLTLSVGTGNLFQFSTIANFTTGIRIGGSAASGEYLRGNGTNFVSSAIQVGDLPSGAVTDLNDVGNVTLTTPGDGAVLCFTGTSNNSVDCTVGGDATATEDSGTLTIAVTDDSHNHTSSTIGTDLDWSNFANAMTLDSDTTITAGDAEEIQLTSSHTNGDAQALTIAATLGDNASAVDDYEALRITLTNSSESADAGDTARGLRMIHADSATNHLVDAMIDIESQETTTAMLTDAIIVRATTTDSITDAIDVSDAELLNAINIGANNVITAASTLASTELDILDGGVNFSELAGTVSDTQIADAAVDGGSGGEIADGTIDGEDMNANYAGRSLTETAGTPDVLDVDAEIYTEVENITIQDPVTGDSGEIDWVCSGNNGCTITKVWCSTNAGTVTINFEERAEATPQTAGTPVLSAGLVCDSTSQSSCASGCDVDTITNAGIDRYDPINLQVDAVATSPGTVRIHVEYTKDE